MKIKIANPKAPVYKLYGIGLGYAQSTSSSIVGAERIAGAKADSVKLYHLTIAPSLLNQLLHERLMSRFMGISSKDPLVKRS